ncbi:cell division protein ZapC [Shewanella sp. D64]|uniref:cell division protein ZapC n=1 Tax=unclassified Shewanella TaxID=196818 RepID=UPI0022BA2ED2|nr:MULTISPECIES: cell division protein ZapC [unclassified Shewanella]MEC4724319.1 cell division protein ZapC [Shewanella sp. D64]MEC4738831.1 cell division protein ZapC [Shewanella sp. E94]WBJ97730.1 cell division protein ZapC [Shewanella sp. MTB7]
MLLMPKRDWQWRYDDSYGVLSVSLGSEMEFLTPYKSKLLIPDALSELNFSVEHAKFYIDFVDLLTKSLNISDAVKVQLALNGTAAYFLLKPQMPKSWFFDTSTMCVYSELGKVFQLRCQGVTAQVLVVETNIQASLVMILSKQLTLNATKTLMQFECIKVMNDRLHPLKTNRAIAAA